MVTKKSLHGYVMGRTDGDDSAPLSFSTESRFSLIGLPDLPGWRPLIPLPHIVFIHHDVAQILDDLHELVPYEAQESGFDGLYTWTGYCCHGLGLITTLEMFAIHHCLAVIEFLSGKDPFRKRLRF